MSKHVAPPLETPVLSNGWYVYAVDDYIKIRNIHFCNNTLLTAYSIDYLWLYNENEWDTTMFKILLKTDKLRINRPSKNSVRLEEQINGPESIRFGQFNIHLRTYNLDLAFCSSLLKHSAALAVCKNFSNFRLVLGSC